MGTFSYLRCLRCKNVNIYNRSRIIYEGLNHPSCKASLEAWYLQVKNGDYQKFQDIKADFSSASHIEKKLVCFNLKGNNYRLICAFNYPLRRCFIKWFGTHKEYDKLDTKQFLAGQT